MADEPNLLKTELPGTPDSLSEAFVDVQEEQEGEKREVEAPEPTESTSQPESSTEQEVTEAEVSEAPTAAPTPVVAAPVVKDQMMQDIENILAEDLTDVFLQLTPEKRNAFKQAGEEAALKIKVMMEMGKVKAKKMLDIIRDWLRLVPGVNKFFLEQEAKIKTDKLVDYFREQSNDVFDQ